LNLTNITMADAGTYSLIVSNALGSAASSGAVLTVIPAPSILSITLSQGVVAVTFSTVAGRTYQLQSAPDLISGNWTPVGRSFQATGGTATKTGAAVSNTQQFYRIELVR
jgi:hypothetical protein